MNAELRERIGDRRVIASISGGKDSAALSLWLHEQGIDHDRVFLDTGWEHPLTYEYLRGELTRVIGPIQEVCGPETMREIILRKRMLPSRGIRWCTQLLKQQPMKRHLRALMDAGIEPINAVGIRRDESEARAASLEWEESKGPEGFDCEVWRPLVEWTFADVVAIHARHNLKPNPLYLLGAERVGCWPCVNSVKDEVRMVAELTPEKIDELRKLEAVASAGVAERMAAKGEAAKEPSAWFRWPIDETVEWSKTSHGGKQFNMLHVVNPASKGCMRWGLCDTGSKAVKP